MELEEAKKQCELMRDYLHFEENREAIDTVLRTLQRYEKQIDLDYVDKNYISKEKIRAKINYIKSNYSKINGDYFMMNYAIQVLQELLEEGENNEKD